MKVRHRMDVGGAVREGWRWVVLMLEDLRGAPARVAERRHARTSAPEQEQMGQEGPADERTMRRTAEAQHGGISSAESAARYERGENPGGTHHKAVRREEGAEHQRPEQEEPQGRAERVPGGENHLPETRRGS